MLSTSTLTLTRFPDLFLIPDGAQPHRASCRGPPPRGAPSLREARPQCGGEVRQRGPLDDLRLHRLPREELREGVAAARADEVLAPELPRRAVVVGPVPDVHSPAARGAEARAEHGALAEVR